MRLEMTSKKKVVNLIALVLLVGFALTAQTTYGDTIKLPNNGGTITGKLVATSGPTKSTNVHKKLLPRAYHDYYYPISASNICILNLLQDRDNKSMAF
jgi:hypothetical protein